MATQPYLYNTLSLPYYITYYLLVLLLVSVGQQYLPELVFRQLYTLIQAGKDMLLVDFVNLLLWALNGMTTSSRIATL
jgi:hypothetical protein